MQLLRALTTHGDTQKGLRGQAVGIYKQLYPDGGFYLTHAGQRIEGPTGDGASQVANLELETRLSNVTGRRVHELKKSENKGLARGSNAWAATGLASRSRMKQTASCLSIDQLCWDNSLIISQVELDSMGGEMSWKYCNVEAELFRGPTMMGRKARELLLSGPQ
ncbi:TPA: hypothetical protein ACH3X2_002312 [Trebouxia sp. C0005]